MSHLVTNKTKNFSFYESLQKKKIKIKVQKIIQEKRNNFQANSK